MSRLQGIAVLLPHVQQTFGIRDEFAGISTLTTFVGMMLGCTFWGTLTDVYGRLVTFFVPLLIAGMLMIFTSMAKTFVQICFLYGLIGFMISSSLTNDGTLFVELVPKSHEYLIMVLSTFWGIGTCFAALLGYFLLQNESSSERWRNMVAILGLVTLGLGGIRWIVRKKVHQSVQFLASKHDWRNVHKILSNIAEYNHYSDDEFESMMNHIDDVSIEVEEKQALWKTMRPLFSRQRYQITLAIWCIWGLLALAYTIFNGYIFKLLESVKTEQAINPYSVYLVFSVGNIPGTCFAAWIAKHVSYRTIFIGSTFSVSMGIFCFFLWMTIQYDATLLYICMVIISLSQSIMYGALYSLTPIVFETKIRGTATGIAASISRMAGICGPILVGLLLQFSNGWMMSALTASSLLMIACVLGFVCKR